MTLTPIRAVPRFPWLAYLEIAYIGVPLGVTVGLVACLAALVAGWL